MIGIFLTLLILIGLYLFAIRPNVSRKEQVKPFEQVYIAHRGLHDKQNIPENSLPAFENAVEQGYGIELDVQLTKDGKLVVFHDETLTRMCGINKRVNECDYEQLCLCHLLDTKQRIPLFEQVKNVIDGKVPVIIEIKSGGNPIQTARVLARQMQGYEGIYCIESFEPSVLHWYAVNHPQVIRGQLATDYVRNRCHKPFWQKIFLSSMVTNRYAKPDFIAFNYKYDKFLPLSLCKWLYHPKLAAWTIRNPKALKKAQKSSSIIIFDGFIPDEENQKDA